MHTLSEALSEHDLVTLRTIGEWWELDLTGADKGACVQALVETLNELDLELELSYLPPEEAKALHMLAQAEGRMPVGTFSRQHGEVRQMGPGRLEREEPWLDPVSPAEALWYRGFLYRAFDQGDGEELVEYFYLPQELYGRYPTPPAKAEPSGPDGALQPTAPPVTFDNVDTTAVDDLTTLLAFAQRDPLARSERAELHPYLFNAHADRFSLLLTLATETALLREGEDGLRPMRAAVAWLKETRAAQVRALADAWSRSNWNELCHTPELTCEGSGWHNDPIAARTALLDALPHTRDWYALADLVAHVKETNPDFQRPEGNYDTWYIREVTGDAAESADRSRYLKGFENWERVEGRLLRFLVEGPLVWLGLAESGEGRFRLTEHALAWLADEAPAGQAIDVPLVVQADATLLVPHNASRYKRFQVARIAQLEPLRPGQPYHYRLTPASLARAREAGIQPARMLDFLREASGRTLPASMQRAIERWVERGVEGRLQPAVILRVRDAAILDTLQSNPRTRAFLGERLGELAAMVRREDWRQLQQATAQLGLLLEIDA